MFEKIFGIFRKRKKADISQAILGENGDDMLDGGGIELGDEFDADTISLETGMSDGGFGSSSGGAAEGGPADAVGVTEPPLDEDLGLDIGEEAPAAPLREGVISPPPEVEPFVPRPKRKTGRLKSAIAAVLVALIGLAAGFFGAKPGIELAKDLLTAGPTPAQQLAQLQTEDTKFEQQLTAYRAVGTLEEMQAVKAELQKRNDMAAQIDAIEGKVANRPAEEERLDRVSVQLDLTKRDLLVQKGSLANVQKAIKQIDARNNYLMTSTRKFLDQTVEAKAKSDVLKARLDPEKVEEAETEAFLSRDVQQEAGRVAKEALSSL